MHQYEKYTSMNVPTAGIHSNPSWRHQQQYGISEITAADSSCWWHWEKGETEVIDAKFRFSIKSHRFIEMSG